MRITRLRSLLVLCLAGLLLGGCASKEAKDSDRGLEPESQAPYETTDGPVEPAGTWVEDGKVVVSDGRGSREVLQGLFYFDFDDVIVKREGHEELNKHAEVLIADRSLQARLEGHADERGTREYNLALGERRANAILAYLVTQGVGKSQLEVISYGEEKPVDFGHGEFAWVKNRRVEIVYR